jgi:hypothetical protein
MGVAGIREKAEFLPDSDASQRGIVSLSILRLERPEGAAVRRLLFVLYSAGLQVYT